MSATILGLSAYYHDSAAALLVDGRIVAAAQEERFTRVRHDASFPAHACRYVLEEGGYALGDVDAVAFYDKPFLKFERLLETYHAFAPRGLTSFVTAMPVWIKEKLFTRRLLTGHLRELGDLRCPLFFPEHHLSHAASAFYPSPFDDAAIVTIDGVGEWATTTIGRGHGSAIEILSELHFPHSIGLLYSAFTYYCGFTVNSGEYKLMGLAPYGNPSSSRTEQFRRAITSELVDVRPDGSILLNMPYFDFATGLRMVREDKWEQLFGVPRRAPESDLTQVYMDLALAIQQVTEDVVLTLARTAKAMTGSRHLTLAGGVALNCVANGTLLREDLFDDIWIQPAAGDAGGAVGAAYAVWHIHRGEPRAPAGRDRTCHDAMSGSYLGPSFSSEQIARAIRRHRGVATRHDDVSRLSADVAGRLAAGQVGGWFQGRMEFGPRALGNRSIIGDARNAAMQKTLNLKVKYREGFRPFAPAVLEEDVADHFDLDRPSPYMLLVAPIRKHKQHALPAGYAEQSLGERLYFVRSDLPAITHIDYSARIQTISRATNPRFWELVNAFKSLTGYGVIVNTSFNVRGEPIVCTPEEAYRCFMRTEMDFLVLGDYLLDKKDQPPFEERSDWRKDLKD
ncbi:MAG TPA: carbamoyltransferase [Vicinamibacterales bacterium]|nr:carbamoyltransferase [Vicinamibacterales bacterium]